MIARWPFGPVTNGGLVVAGSALFILANALLAPGLAPLAGAVVLAGSVASLGLMVWLGRTAPGSLLGEPVRWRTLAACAALALVLCLLGGEGHLFYPNEDWLTRDAVLGDMVRQPFPITYSHEGREFLLRAPLGMYMLPALIGRWFGIGAAHGALLAQNATLFALTLYLFTIASRIGTAMFLALFVAFSGLDVLPSLIVSIGRTGSLWLPQHLEGAINGLQYSSNVTQIFWVPNHALPGWWFAALAILVARGQLGLPVLATMIAALTFWSPLAMIGALPIMLVLLAGHVRELARSPAWWYACAAAAGLLPVLLYLIADAGTIPQRWLITKSGFATLCILFLAFELPHFAIIRSAWTSIGTEFKGMLIASGIVLVLLPTYQMGPGNDFLTRGSIVPLAILAFVFCSLVPELVRGTNRVLASVTAGIVLLGAVTPVFEVGRAVATPAFAISSCNILSAWSQYDPDRWISNYMAATDHLPGWLVRATPGQPSLRVETAKCWPDHPIDPLPMDWQDPRNGVPSR